MTTTDKDVAARLRAMAAELDGTVVGTAAATLRAEADRLDPPAPTGRVVTWERDTYQLSAAGDIALSRKGRPDGLVTPRAYIDNVILPLLANAPDGPIPDETVEKAWRAFKQAEMSEADERDAMECALTEVRGLPGMAVVRAGKAPEVIAWGLYDPKGELAGPYDSRSAARAVNCYDERVVAIIADPGEGTV